MKYLVAQSLNKEKNDWISPIVLQLANDGIREWTSESSNL